MASPKHTLPPSSNSDVMSFLSEMKEEILTKLTHLEEDNRKLKQELHEIKSSQKHNDAASKKRDERDDEAEHKDENPNNKKARVSVSVASLPSEPEPEPEPGHLVEPPASFDTLDDDCIGNVLDFVGKKSYSVFGLLNKNCHEIFCSKGLPKETYRYGYAPLLNILQRRNYDGFRDGVLHYNRIDLLDWILGDEHYKSEDYLKYLCDAAIQESRLDILRQIFRRAKQYKLECLRAFEYYGGGIAQVVDEDGNYHDKTWFDLCSEAARCDELEIFKFLIENECDCGENRDYLSKAVLDDDRKDMLEWMLTDESEDGYERLKRLCCDAIKESRLDILREVFQRANKEQLEYLRNCNIVPDLSYDAAQFAKPDCFEFLRENECKWNVRTWKAAKRGGHEHILNYLRNNGYLTKWQN